MDIKVNGSITLKSNCDDLCAINQNDIERIVKEAAMRINKNKNSLNLMSDKRKGSHANLGVGFLFSGNLETTY